ncbi:mammalian cell entry protein [Mycobacteroides chelonae]|nr:mammalian cell entry protein [Mycobacteroides chelonae]
MKTTRYAAPLLAGLLLTTGCSIGGLGSVPLPAPGIGSSSYTLTAKFSNALNLPLRAKVRYAGADIGEVESMSAINYEAVTRLRVRSDVQLPFGSNAELRSATPLGDVFVSIAPPPQPDPLGRQLTNGDTIGLESTSAASTVESVLSSAAVLVNGGAIRNFTNVINGLGKASGDRGEAFGDLINESNRLLDKFDNRSAQLESAVNEVSALSNQLNTKNATITELMTASKPAFDTLADNVQQINALVSQIGGATNQLAKFPSIAGTDRSGRSLIADANTLSRAFSDVTQSPDISLAAINRLLPLFVKITPGQSFSVNAQMDRLVLGSIPDIGGFQGDPGLHGPKRYNWAQLVGSIKYSLWRLQERVVGQGPDSPMGQAPPPAPESEPPR